MAFTDKIFPWLGYARCLETPPSLADQAVAELRCDAAGRLIVTNESDAAIPYSQTAFTGTAGVVRSSGGLVGGIYAASLSDDHLFLQLHNLAASPPAGGAVPQHTFPLVAGGVVSIEVLGGLAFELGCVAAISSTPTTYTAVAGSPAHLIAKHRGT